MTTLEMTTEVKKDLEITTLEMLKNFDTAREEMEKNFDMVISELRNIGLMWNMSSYKLSCTLASVHIFIPLVITVLGLIVSLGEIVGVSVYKMKSKYQAAAV